VSIKNEWINKMWSILAMKYYSVFKKEGHFDTCYNVDEPRRPYAKWNKPVTKGQILHAFT